MPGKKPSVSVLMPFYDNGSTEGRRQFSEAFKAVLGQTYRDFEVVVVASGEKGFVSSLARRHRKMRLFFFGQKVIPGRSIPLKEKVYGLVTARNMCISHARGKYAAFADYDDVSLPHRLKTQAAFLDSHPEIGAVGSSMLLIDSDGKPMGLRSVFEEDHDIRRHMVQFNTVPQPTLMARTALIRKAGGYRAGIPEDYDLWVRMAGITKFHNFREPLIKYRIHPGGGTSNYKLELYVGSLRVKWRAAKALRIQITMKDVAVSALQFLSLFFPNSVRRVIFERIRSSVVIGN
ncbi:Glycosyl transferase family 2 [uncultured archaeon]|nr:Glycosyl transferase family 2 [uncultured archaeon]